MFMHGKKKKKEKEEKKKDKRQFFCVWTLGQRIDKRPAPTNGLNPQPQWVSRGRCVSSQNHVWFLLYFHYFDNLAVILFCLFSLKEKKDK